MGARRHANRRLRAAHLPHLQCWVILLRLILHEALDVREGPAAEQDGISGELDCCRPACYTMGMQRCGRHSTTVTQRQSCSLVCSGTTCTGQRNLITSAAALRLTRGGSSWPPAWRWCTFAPPLLSRGRSTSGSPPPALRPKVRSRNHVNPMADVAERRGGCQNFSQSSDALHNQDGRPNPKPLFGTSSYLQMQRERTFILHVAGQRVAVGT